MLSVVSPNDTNTWFITIDGVGYGVICTAPTLEAAISRGRALSADPVGKGDTIRIYGADGLAALVVDGVVFVRREGQDAS